MEKKRLYLLDSARGLLIISMILYHLIYDLYYIYHYDISWFASLGGRLWQKISCYGYIILSGYCFSLGKRHIKRGAFLILCGTIITIITACFMPDEAIYYGILTFYGLATLITHLLDKALKKGNPIGGISLSILLFNILYNIPKGSIMKASVPDILYEARLLTFLGFPYEGFKSSDYFPLIPWYFMFLVGYYLYMLTKDNKKTQAILSIRIPLLDTLGRKALIIYLVHQPLIVLILHLIHE